MKHSMSQKSVGIQKIGPNASNLQQYQVQQQNLKEFISDNASYKSNNSNEVYWSDHLNLRFNTHIFT
jgi:hypothetical protein